MHIPKYDELIWPTLEAITELGGSGTTQEIYEKIIELENIPEEVQEYFDEKSKNSTIPKLRYNYNWAR